MTFRPPQLTPAEKAKQMRNPELRWSDDIAAKGPYGPTAKELQLDPEIRKSLLPNLKLSEGSDAGAHAIGSLRTFWLLDPADPDNGIWGANLVADQDVRAAQEGGFPMASGFYRRIGDIPGPEVMRGKARQYIFQPNFKDEYDRLYPDPEKNKPAAPAAPVLKPIQRPTLELTVIDNEIIACKTSEGSAGDEAHPGVPLAGIGAWEKFMGDKKPRDYGLPKPILAFQEDTGEVTPAHEEYESVKLAAQKGDPGAQEAMKALGLAF